MTAVVVDVIVKDEIDGEGVSRCLMFSKNSSCEEEDLKIVMIITITLRQLVEITLQTDIRAIIL